MTKGCLGNVWWWYFFLEENKALVNIYSKFYNTNKTDKLSFGDGKHVPALLTFHLFDLYHKKMLQKQDNHALENPYFRRAVASGRSEVYITWSKNDLSISSIWQTERSILFRKDKAFKWFILLCNYTYVQQKTRKHRRGQGRIALLIRRILSNWNKKHTHSICTFQKNIIIIIISQNVETLLFPNTHQNLATKKPSKNTKTKNTGKPSPPTTQRPGGRGWFSQPS